MANAKTSSTSKPAAEVAAPTGPSRAPVAPKSESVDYIREGVAVFKVTTVTVDGVENVSRQRVDGPNGELPEGIKV